jgi:dihydroxy-acid dehydratase
MHVPLLVNLQPAGTYLGEDYPSGRRRARRRRATDAKGLIREGALTVNGKTMGENCKGAEILLPDVIRTMDTPLVEDAGFLVLSGNLFDNADHEDSASSRPSSANATCPIRTT